MVIQQNQLQDGDILIGHSLPATSLLLLDKKIRVDEGRFLDFCTLANALTLHDRLITLPAIVDDDISKSSLYKYLIKNGILEELQFSYRDLLEEHRFEMADLLGDMVSEFDIEHFLVIMAYTALQYTGSSISEENEINHLRSQFVDKIINSSRESWNRQSYNLPISNENEKTYRIRTAEYWEASGMLQLPFLPDFMRIPIIAGYNARIRQSIRMFIETKADSLVRKELEEALVIASPMMIPIPNAVSIFLSRYSSTESVEEAFDSIREEFAEERKAIIEWEKQMRMASKEGGYREVLNIMREINSSLNSMVPADHTDIALSVGPGIVQDVLQGLPSPDTAATAISKGLNIIKRWRQRRRISYFNNGKNEALNIKNQQNLLRHAFGTSLTPRQIDRFGALTNYLQKLSDPL